MAVLDTGCKTHYVFTPCCGGNPIKFCRSVPPSLVDGDTYQYIGSDIVGYGGVLESGQCYTVSIVDEFANFPSIFLEVQAGNFLRATQECNDALCPECPKKIVFNSCCDTTVIEFTFDETYDIPFGRLYQYTGTELFFGSGGALIPNGCYFTEIVNTTEEESLSLPSPPPFEEVVLSGRLCNDFYEPIPFCAPCTRYYQITNCLDETETYCTTINLSAYINNLIEDPALWPVIQVTQHPNKCFYVTQIVFCETPAVITPVPDLDPYIGCEACQAELVVYYRLIDCNTDEVILYTSTDLSEYVGKYIKLDGYGDQCFYVEVTESYTGPVLVTVQGDPFETCEECTLPSYRLADCTGIKSDIITNSDLLDYVGSVIVIDSCPDTCWEVFETDATAIYQVSVVSEFEDCPECLLATLTAKCVSFKNTDDKEVDFEVLLPDLDTDKITLNAGQTLAKDCYLLWNVPPAVVVTEYGNCVNGKCPELPKPKRKVTPGYNTPACTPEYYEKVECNFSEWMYKDVLEKRYGISNCCPEELMKWEIRHEMLMLDALVNPDYTCLPQADCGCPQPTTCNCSCNSGN